VAEEETSTHVLCECEALATLRPTYLGSFSLTLRVVEVQGKSGTLLKGKGSHDLDISLRGTNGLSKRPMRIRTDSAQTQLLFYCPPSPTCGRSLKLIHI